MKDLLKEKQKPFLSLKEKKRYFDSANYFLSGAAAELSKVAKGQSFEILDKFKIKRLQEERKSNVELGVQLGLLTMGLWGFYAVIKKTIDEFPYDVMDNLNEKIDDVKSTFRSTLGAISSEIDVHKHIQNGLKSIKGFIGYMFDLLGLSFDINSSYIKYGHKIQDGKQRENGVFGDLIGSTFQTVLWFGLQRALPDILKKFWNLSLEKRLFADKGILDVLWNDNTGYFHDVGNPFKRRLDTVTLTNDAQNLIESWSKVSTDSLHNLVGNTDWLSSIWHVTNLEDYELSSESTQWESVNWRGTVGENNTIAYFESMYQEISRQMQEIEKEVESGTFRPHIKKGADGRYYIPTGEYYYTDSKGNKIRRSINLIRNSTGTLRHQQGSITPDIISLTYTATMPYSGYKKGKWLPDKASNFAKLNDLLDKADEIIFKFSHESFDEEEEQYQKAIREWWKGYGSERTSATGALTHYTFESAWDIVEMMPHIARLEIYAAKNSLGMARGIFDSYLTENIYSQQVEANISNLILLSQFKDEDVKQYKRGEITGSEFMNKKYTQIDKMIKNKAEYNKRLKEVCNFLLPKVLDDSDFSRIVYKAKEIGDLKLKMFLGNATLLGNNSSVFGGFDNSNKYKQASDNFAEIEGKQLSSSYDNEYASQHFWFDEVGDNQPEEQVFLRSYNDDEHVIGDEIDYKQNNKIRVTKIIAKKENIYMSDGTMREVTLYHYYGIPASGIKKIIRFRTIKEDGSTWIEDYYEYKYHTSQTKYFPVGSMPVKDSSTVSAFFGENIKTSVIEDAISTIEKNYALTEQILSIEDLILRERQKRTRLMSELATTLDEKGILLLLYPIINNLNERVLGAD